MNLKNIKNPKMMTMINLWAKNLKNPKSQQKFPMKIHIWAMKIKIKTIKLTKFKTKPRLL